jgi:5-dehydro-2-deoxygluconokinase
MQLDAPIDALKASFEHAAQFDLVRGFAAGQTIFGAVANGWLRGTLEDQAAVEQMSAIYADLCAAWDTARGAAKNKGGAA